MYQSMAKQGLNIANRRKNGVSGKMRNGPVQRKVQPFAALKSGQENHFLRENEAGETVQRKNETGLPDQLKNGVEQLSGISMDDVRVHYNSSKPESLHALAYTQGTDIHVAPGQEKHLGHEAWHVVQQKQGIVEPTFELNGESINDNQALEREADIMGARALNL